MRATTDSVFDAGGMEEIIGQGRVFYSSLGHVASDFEVSEVLEIMAGHSLGGSKPAGTNNGSLRSILPTSSCSTDVLDQTAVYHILEVESLDKILLISGWVSGMLKFSGEV